MKDLKERLEFNYSGVIKGLYITLFIIAALASLVGFSFGNPLFGMAGLLGSFVVMYLVWIYINLPYVYFEDNRFYFYSTGGHKKLSEDIEELTSMKDSDKTILLQGKNTRYTIVKQYIGENQSNELSILLRSIIDKNQEK